MRIDELSWTETKGWSRHNSSAVRNGNAHIRQFRKCGAAIGKTLAADDGAESGSNMTRLGFYSYGEVSPYSVSGVCELHNQTMTVTAITEAAG